MGDCFGTGFRGLHWDIGSLNDFTSQNLAKSVPKLANSFPKLANSFPKLANSFPKLANSFKPFQTVSVQFCKCGYKLPVCEMGCDKRRRVAAIEHVAYPPLGNSTERRSLFRLGMRSSLRPELCSAWNIYRSWCLRLDDYIFIKMQHAKVMLKIFGNRLANCCETVKLAAHKPWHSVLVHILLQVQNTCCNSQDIIWWCQVCKYKPSSTRVSCSGT